MRSRRQLILAAFARAEGDTAIVRRAVEMELEMARAYASIGAGVSRAELLEQDARAHAESLTASLKRLGGTPPAPPRAPAEPRPSAALALRLELMAVAAYHDALGKLRNPALLHTTASIMANHGQHLVVLREELGGDPLPTAFETGRMA
jgi:Ferritin-like domain